MGNGDSKLEEIESLKKQNALSSAQINQLQQQVIQQQQMQLKMQQQQQQQMKNNSKPQPINIPKTNNPVHKSCRVSKDIILCNPL